MDCIGFHAAIGDCFLPEHCKHSDASDRAVYTTDQTACGTAEKASAEQGDTRSNNCYIGSGVLHDGTN